MTNRREVWIRPGQNYWNTHVIDPGTGEEIPHITDLHLHWQAGATNIKGYYMQEVFVDGEPVKTRRSVKRRKITITAVLLSNDNLYETEDI